MIEQNVKFVSLEEAAKMPGLRITFMPGFPAIFSEALKNICYVKKLPIIPVKHPSFGKDQSFLKKLTAQTSLPTMLYNDEHPRNVWIRQLMLAERIGSGPSLIPTDTADRVLMFGLLNETLGEDSLIWNKRLLFGDSAFSRKYGYTSKAAARAKGRCLEVLRTFDAQLKKQKESGSPFLISNSLTALDVYWATSSYMISPPGPDLMPLTKENRPMKMMFGRPKDVRAAFTPRMLEHRNFILKTYCETPSVIGGTPLSSL